MTGIGRELLAKANKKLSYPKKKRLPEKFQELIDKIILSWKEVITPE